MSVRASESFFLLLHRNTVYTLSASPRRRGIRRESGVEGIGREACVARAARPLNCGITRARTFRQLAAATLVSSTSIPALEVSFRCYSLIRMYAALENIRVYNMSRDIHVKRSVLQAVGGGCRDGGDRCERERDELEMHINSS